MYSQPLRKILERRKLVTAPPQTTVYKAAKVMALRRVGAILVVEDERLTGIFTERDLVFRVIARDRDPHATLLEEVMTRDPKTARADNTFGYALLLMHENGFRHVPVVENGKPIGVVSSRNALDPDLEEFAAESHRREEFERERARA